MRLFRNSLFFTFCVFFVFFVFFVRSSFLRVCGGSSSVLQRLESVELHWLVVCEVSGRFWVQFQWTLRSRQVVWMILLRMFFVFKGSWRKFFGTLEAWIYWAPPICGLLRFLEAFELDSNDLWDLGRWFGWFLFECSSYSKLKFLEASKLGSNRASGLFNLGVFPALSGSPTSSSLEMP